MDEFFSFLCDQSPTVSALDQDLSIASGFFGDAEAFARLAEDVFPQLVRHKASSSGLSGNPGQPQQMETAVRIWVSGCATGEEAYSIAMLLLEQSDRENAPVAIVILATDMNPQALRIARRGIYSDGKLAGVSSERRHRFFHKIDDHHWQVTRRLRETITFATHDLSGDIPFARMNLISCRYHLGHLDCKVQTRLIRLLHTAMAPDGYLMLPPTEVMEQEANLFETISGTSRIYRRIRHEGPLRLMHPVDNSGEARASRGKGGPAPPPTSWDLMQRLLIDEFAPASVLINRNHQIICVVGPLVKFLEFPFTDLTPDLFSVVRPGLATKIRAAVSQVRATGRALSNIKAGVKRGGVYRPCTIAIKPLSENDDSGELLVVIFQDRASTPSDSVNSATGSATTEHSLLVQQLEQEARAARDILQTTIEEHKGVRDQLIAANEEIQSVNEELRAANEELSLSKESLQSLNKELIAVNNQLGDKVGELDRANSDLTNLVSSSDIATLFLDKGWRIKRFTPSLAGLLNLSANDVDRSIRDLIPALEDRDLLADCDAVLEKLIPIEKEIWTGNDAISHDVADMNRQFPALVSRRPGPRRCFLRRVLPYYTTDYRIDGVVITLMDITERLKSEAQSRQLASVLRNTRDAVIIHDFNGTILAWNRGATEMYGYTEAEARRMNIRATIPHKTLAEMEDYTQAIRRDETVTPFETQRITKDRRTLDIDLTVTAYCDDRERAIGVATIERDITERKRANAALRQSEELLRAILDTALDAIITIDRDWIIKDVNPSAERIFGFQANELIGNNVRMLMDNPPRDQQEIYLSRAQRRGEGTLKGTYTEITARRKDGTTFPADLAISAVDHLGLFTGIVRDISHRKELEKQILEVAIEEQRRIGRELHDGTGQELTGLSLFAGTVVDLLKLATPSVPGDQQNWTITDTHFQQLRQTAERLTTGLVSANLHVQQLSRGMMPVQIDAGGLAQALRELATTTNGHQGIECWFEYPQPVSLSDNTTATHLYRIAQESVNNSIKHGRATRICVALFEEQGCTVLQVTDNGVGFEPADPNRRGSAGRTRGFGLELMNYRAGMIGGTLSIVHRAAGGIEVKCIISQKGL